MTSTALISHPAFRQFQGCLHDSPATSHRIQPHQLAPRSSAEWQNQLPPILQSPQQKVLTEARLMLQHNRQTDPSYAALPAFTGLDGQTHAQLTDIRAPTWNNAETRHIAGMHGVSTSALQELGHLLPDLRLTAYTNSTLVKVLAADTGMVASRLLQLKLWFPSANVSIMVAHRPSLVLGEFAGIPAARAVLHKWFHNDAVDLMVQKQPLFLVEDVEDAISSLNRWMSTTNGAHKLQQNPSLLTSLVPNRKLSLW